MDSVNIYSKLSILPDELKAEVSDFIDFLIQKNKKKPSSKKPIFGCAKGQIYISPDFDEPLEDFKEYME